MTPGQHTELFFLDEATAPATGHRPCAECQRDHFNFIKVHLPPPPAHPKGGRPRESDRRCFEGILWILRTVGAPWSELPKQYGSPNTCWRRLREWEASGAFPDLWHAFLADLNERQKLPW